MSDIAVATHSLWLETNPNLVILAHAVFWHYKKEFHRLPFKRHGGHHRLETTAIYLNFTDANVIEEFSNKW